MPRRCWRVKVVTAIPSPVLDFPFSLTIAVFGLIYGPKAIAGQMHGAIDFLPYPFEMVWGGLFTTGSLITIAALVKRRTGTWLPTGLWVSSLTMLAYVAWVLFGFGSGAYQTRVTICAILGSIGVIQAFKMQTGQLWAVAAIEASEDQGPTRE